MTYEYFFIFQDLLDINCDIIISEIIVVKNYLTLTNGSLEKMIYP